LTAVLTLLRYPLLFKMMNATPNPQGPMPEPL
jgi:hypothetical protein